MKKIKRKITKEERGSITLYTLAAMMFFLIILMLTYSRQMDKITSQRTQVEKISEEYNAGNEMEEAYNKALNAALTGWKETEDGITNGMVTVQIGDYVNYNHLAGVDTNNTDVTTYTSTEANNGYGDQVFNITNYTGKWRVLGAENGQLLLISADIVEPDSGGYYELKGQAGYSNGISELDKISSKYGQGTYAKGARSVTVDDINKITGYNPNNVGVRDPNQTGSGTKYGAGEIWEYENRVTFSWDEGTPERPYYSSSNGLTGYLDQMYTDYFYWYDNGWKKSACSYTNETITSLTSNFYTYYPETLTDTQNSSATTGITQTSAAYDTVFGSKYLNYWLSSRYVETTYSYVDFSLYYINNGQVGRSSRWYLYNSIGNVDGANKGIRPVVSLASDILLTKEADEWKISQ